MISYLLFQKILQLFLIMAMGFALVKTKIAKSEDSIVLSKLSIYVLMPVTILNAFQIEVTAEIRTGMLYAFGAAFLFQGALVLVGMLAKKIWHLDTVEANSIIYSNAGNLVIPLVSSVLGEEWVIYASAYVSVQLFFLWSHGISGFMNTGRIDLKKIFLNINMLSVLAGIVMLVTGFTLPPLIKDTTSSVSAMLGPSAMLITGMLVGGMPFRKIRGNLRTYGVCFLRLLAFPAVILLLVWVLHMKTWVANGNEILLVSFLAIITPAASSITSFAQLFGKDAEYAGVINILTTLLCIVTMPVMVMLYQWI